MLKIIIFFIYISFSYAIQAMDADDAYPSKLITHFHPKPQDNWALRAQMRFRLQPFFKWAEERLPIDRKRAALKKALEQLQLLCKIQISVQPRRAPHYTSYTSSKLREEMRMRLQPLFRQIESDIIQKHIKPMIEFSQAQAKFPFLLDIQFIVPAIQLLAINKKQKKDAQAKFNPDLRTLFDGSNFTTKHPLSPKSISHQRTTAELFQLSRMQSSIDQDIYT